MMCLFFLHVKFIFWFINTSIYNCKFIYLFISFTQCSMTKYWSFCKWDPSPCFKNIVPPLLSDCHGSLLLFKWIWFLVYLCVFDFVKVWMWLCVSVCVCMILCVRACLCTCISLCEYASVSINRNMFNFFTESSREYQSTWNIMCKSKVLATKV